MRRVDPAELALARRPVAEDRMHVAVDQARARRRCRCASIDGLRALGVDSPSPCRPRRSGRRSTTMVSASRIGLVDVARQQQADVADDDLARLVAGAASAMFLSSSMMRGDARRLCVRRDARCPDALDAMPRSTDVDHERFPVRERLAASPAARRGTPTACSGSTCRSSRSRRSAGRGRAPRRRRGTGPARRRAPGPRSDRADRRRRILARPQRLRDVPAAVQVLGVEQRDELGVAPVVAPA